MTVDQAVRVVQVSYPQVYLACHTRHQRKRSTEHRLSARDSSILAHLDERHPIPGVELAKHLGIARSTMSEALKRLRTLGFVNKAQTRGIILTERGAAAIRDTSVLESDRLRDAIISVSLGDRDLICRGLARLAEACRSLRASPKS